MRKATPKAFSEEKKKNRLLSERTKHKCTSAAQGNTKKKLIVREVRKAGEKKNASSFTETLS